MTLWLTSLSWSFTFIPVLLHFQFLEKLKTFGLDTNEEEGCSVSTWTLSFPKAMMQTQMASPHLFHFSCFLFYKKCWNSGANLWQHYCGHKFPQLGQHALRKGTRFFLQKSTSKRPFAMKYSPQAQQYVRAAEAVTSPVPNQILQW